jgi:phage-related protein (TIGR01555 family)
MAKHKKKPKSKADKPEKESHFSQAKPLPTPAEKPRTAAVIRRATDKARERGPEQVARQRFPIQPPTILPGVVPSGKSSAVAMDYNPGVYAYAAQCAGSTFDGFPGYPYLANLSTRAEYRAFASTMSTELTRKWIEIKSKGDDTEKMADAHKISRLREELDRLGVRDLFQKLAEQDCYFGRAQFSINIDGANEELPLVISPKTIKQGSLRSFTAIEPMWTSPSAYNALDPTAPDFYVPREWFILGKRIHASRLLTIVTRPLPDMLKPAFNFSGMSLSQLAEPYVNNWLRTRQSVADLINNFSITTLKTNMQNILQGGCEDGADSVIARADLFTATRSNLGLMLLDMDGEDLAQINTPLSGLHELQAQSQEHMCSVSKIPAMILTGISPSGLNASSDGEIRTFYDWVAAQQQAFWAKPLDTVIKVVMLHLWGEIDPTITYEFCPLWQMSEEEESNIRVNEANADGTYIDRGVLSPEDVRKRLSSDQNSGYAGIHPSDLPEMPVSEEFDAEGNPLDPTPPEEREQEDPINA